MLDLPISIAWMESYLTFANFFSNFDMSLYETDDTTVTWKDCGNAMIKSHIKVTVDKAIGTV